ncbi:hypothetical protein M0804_005298 [Polistes exclamans]|nr:hypothetical protein M0804_005298 [Polistes exclamans]
MGCCSVPDDVHHQRRTSIVLALRYETIHGGLYAILPPLTLSGLDHKSSGSTDKIRITPFSRIRGYHDSVKCTAAYKRGLEHE